MNAHLRIRRFRVMRHLSQEFMAGELKIDTSSYCRIERGNIPISVKRLEQIASILNVSTEELVCAKQGPTFRERPSTNEALGHIIRQLETEIRLLRDEMEHYQPSRGVSAPNVRHR